MSNLDECCLFGVLIPSGTSFGVDVKRSNAIDLVPRLGGARSPGIVSAAPGGGICCRRVSSCPTFGAIQDRVKGESNTPGAAVLEAAYRRISHTGAYDNAWGHWLTLPCRCAWRSTAALTTHTAWPMLRRQELLRVGHRARGTLGGCMLCATVP